MRQPIALEASPSPPPIRYGVLYELMVSAHTLTLVHGDCHLDNIFFSG